MGLWTRIGIMMASFVLIFSYFAGNIPRELYISGYEPIGGDMGISSIDPSAMNVNMSDISHSLIYMDYVDYQFSSGNELRDVRVHWINENSPIFEADFRIYRYKGGVVYRNRGLFEPDVTKELLEAVWDSAFNVSILRVRDGIGSIWLEFTDNNALRNNITTAFDDRQLDLKIRYPLINARQPLLSTLNLIQAVLTFNLPNVFPSVDRYMSFVISVFIIVPLTFVLFGLFARVVRGVET